MYFAYGQTETDYLKAKDSRLAAVIDRLGHINRTVDTNLFSSVVHHIIGQQIYKSTGDHLARMRDALGGDAAGSIAAQPVFPIARHDLPQGGITVMQFAERVRSDTLSNLKREVHGDADEIPRALSSLGGYRRMWTAEMILLFCLQRPNVASTMITIPAQTAHGTASPPQN